MNNFYLFSDSENLAEMRYFATYWLDHQPRVTGCTTDIRYESSHHETILASCQEFTVANVEVDKTLNVDNFTFAANVTLIAGNFLIPLSKARQDTNLPLRQVPMQVGLCLRSLCEESQ